MDPSIDLGSAFVPGRLYKVSSSVFGHQGIICLVKGKIVLTEKKLRI